ncbi:MAG: ATP phosphoribosyltransferase regulatory subunit [Cypionkella sp.]|nr:ATP phosphoribosyltransferase regulatory subunit [Cypionkella sp.]
MVTKAQIAAEAERLFSYFQSAGAVPVDADILLPAETILDLYGEDIRARAYTALDPVRGEMMLRPDFTLPVVQAHMAGGADPARYCYRGEVFRKQDHLSDAARPSEYTQVGFELFDRANPEGADAEVFALIARALEGLPLRAVTGDIGILTAAVRGLSTTPARRAALMRHIWRPARFRALLDRFSARTPASPARAALLERLNAGDLPAQIAAAGPMIGLRSEGEIIARAQALLGDADAAPIPDAEAGLLSNLLALAAPAPQALAALHHFAGQMPSLAPAVARFAARLDALRARGVEVDTLPFEASLGRASMEYYDGFVFTFTGAAGLPPYASGGRYDALTAVLGAGRSIPAVGGVIRPHLVAQLRGAL